MAESVRLFGGRIVGPVKSPALADDVIARHNPSSGYRRRIAVVAHAQKRAGRHDDFTMVYMILQHVNGGRRYVNVELAGKVVAVRSRLRRCCDTRMARWRLVPLRINCLSERPDMIPGSPIKRLTKVWRCPHGSGTR